VSSQLRQAHEGNASCERCETRPDDPCPACNARRRHAVRLVEQRGLSITVAASRMGLSAARVERLLEEHADHAAVGALRQADVANAPLRELLERRRASDPDLTSAEIARRLGSSAVQVERWLGLRATAPKRDRHGRRYPARRLERISVDVAGRVARELGYLPCDLDGC
jgi:transposase